MPNSIFTPFVPPKEKEKTAEYVKNWLDINRPNYEMLHKVWDNPNDYPNYARYRDKLLHDIDIYGNIEWEYYKQVEVPTKKYIKTETERLTAGEYGKAILDLIKNAPRLKGYKPGKADKLASIYKSVYDQGINSGLDEADAHIKAGKSILPGEPQRVNG